MSDVYVLPTAIKTSNFKELHKTDGSVSIHHQNIRFLAVEMFKVFKDISPQVVKEIFQFREEIFQFRDAVPDQ